MMIDTGAGSNLIEQKALKKNKNKWIWMPEADKYKWTWPDNNQYFRQPVHLQSNT